MLNGTKARLTIVAGGEKIYVYKEISKSVTVERKKKKNSFSYRFYLLLRNLNETLRHDSLINNPMWITAHSFVANDWVAHFILIIYSVSWQGKKKKKDKE